MKGLANALVVLGLLLLTGSVVGKAIGDPTSFIGRKVLTLLMFSNTAFLLAIVAKLSEKK